MNLLSSSPSRVQAAPLSCRSSVPTTSEKRAHGSTPVLGLQRRLHQRHQSDLRGVAQGSSVRQLCGDEASDFQQMMMMMVPLEKRQSTCVLWVKQSGACRPCARERRGACLWAIRATHKAKGSFLAGRRKFPSRVKGEEKLLAQCSHALDHSVRLTLHVLQQKKGALHAFRTSMLNQRAKSWQIIISQRTVCHS